MVVKVLVGLAIVLAVLVVQVVVDSKVVQVVRQHQDKVMLVAHNRQLLLLVLLVLAVAVVQEV